MRGAVTGGPDRHGVRRAGRVEGMDHRRVVGFRRQLLAQLVLGVRLLDGGAPDLVGGEEQEDDAGTDEDATGEVGRPAETRVGGLLLGRSCGRGPAASLAALRSARVCGAGPRRSSPAVAAVSVCRSVRARFGGRAGLERAPAPFRCWAVLGLRPLLGLDGLLSHDVYAHGEGQPSTVTRVPSGVSGNTTAALAGGISTQPSLWGWP